MRFFNRALACINHQELHALSTWNPDIYGFPQFSESWKSRIFLSRTIIENPMPRSFSTMEDFGYPASRSWTNNSFISIPEEFIQSG